MKNNYSCSGFFCGFFAPYMLDSYQLHYPLKFIRLNIVLGLNKQTKEQTNKQKIVKILEMLDNIGIEHALDN